MSLTVAAEAVAVLVGVLAAAVASAVSLTVNVAEMSLGAAPYVLMGVGSELRS